MTLLILNRRPIAHLIPDWLAGIDEELILITAPLSGLETGADFKHIEEVVAYDSDIVSDRAREVILSNDISRICTTTEVDVLRAARLRQDHGIPGQSLESAIAFRDKPTMKAIAAAAGLPIAPMCRVDNENDLLAASDALGFPFVIKPTRGAGSVGVAIVPNVETLCHVQRACRQQVDGWPSLLAEGWIDGTMYQVDGLMVDGRVLEHTTSQLRCPNLEVVLEGAPWSTWTTLPDDEYGREVSELAADLIAALPAPAEVTAFHAEIFHTKDRGAVVNEIACRPGGAGTVWMYERALGTNLFAESLRGQAGLPYTRGVRTPRRMSGFIWVPPRQGRLVRFPSACPLNHVRSYTTSGRAGWLYERSRSVSDNIAQFLLEAPPDTDMDPVIAEVERWWDHECMWHTP